MPSANELDLEPPPDPRPSWIEVLLLVVMQIGMSVVIHFMGRVFGTEDSAPSVGFFAIFIGAQLFGSFHARHYPGRLVKSFILRLVGWAAAAQVALGAVLLSMLLSQGELSAGVAAAAPNLVAPAVTPSMIIMALALTAVAIMLLSWLGLKLGVLMASSFDPPAGTAA